MEGYKCPRCGKKDSVEEICAQGVVADSQGVFDPDNMGDVSETEYRCWNCGAEFGSRTEEGGLLRLAPKETDYSKRSRQGYEVIHRGKRGVVLFRPTNFYEPYVVAHGYDDSTGTWSHGRYLSSYGDACAVAEGAM